MPMIRTLLPLSCLLLAACSQQPQPYVQMEQPAPTTTPVAPAAATPAPASSAAAAADTADQRLRATGTEPFWAVDVDGTRLLYMTPDNPAGTVLTASQTPFARGSTWDGTHAGQPFSLTLREDGVCSDGMSEREYRYHADFDIAGQQLHGCADSVEELDRPAP